MDKWQEKWAYNKYWVMAHSQAYYERIRLLAKNNDWSDAKNAEFEDLLAKTASKKPTVKTLTNAYQHVWGFILRKLQRMKKNKLIYVCCKNYHRELIN